METTHGPVSHNMKATVQQEDKKTMEKEELELRRDLLRDALSSLTGKYSDRAYSAKYVSEISEALEHTDLAIKAAER